MGRWIGFVWLRVFDLRVDDAAILQVPQLAGVRVIAIDMAQIELAPKRGRVWVGRAKLDFRHRPIRAEVLVESAQIDPRQHVRTRHVRLVVDPPDAAKPWVFRSERDEAVPNPCADLQSGCDQHYNRIAGNVL